MALGVVFLVCLAILAAAWHIQPAREGLGTHQQLGLPECGYYARTGHPCITCGMTTAFSLAVRGRIGAALIVQPAGTVLALACIVTGAVSGYVAWTGNRNRILDWIWDCLLYHYVYTAVIVIIILLAGWGWTWLRLAD